MKTKNLLRLIFGLALSGLYYLGSGYNQAGLVLCLGSTLLTLCATSLKSGNYKKMMLHFTFYFIFAEGLLSSQPAVSLSYHCIVVLFVITGVFLMEMMDQASPRKKQQILAQLDWAVLICTFMFGLLLVFPLSILQWFQNPIYQSASRSTFLVLPLLYFFPVICVECTLFCRKMKEMLIEEKSIQEVYK